MLDISLKIMGLNKNYTLKELEEAYVRLLRSNSDKIKVITDSYIYLKEDLKNKENLKRIFKDRKNELSETSYYGKKYSVMNYNLAKAIEFNFDGDLKKTLRNFEVKDLDDAIRFFELSNFYDALKEYNTRYRDVSSKNYKKI